MALEPEPRNDYWDLSELQQNPLVECADHILEKYYKTEKEMCYCR